MAIGCVFLAVKMFDSGYLSGATMLEPRMDGSTNAVPGAVAVIVRPRERATPRRGPADGMMG